MSVGQPVDNCPGLIPHQSSVVQLPGLCGAKYGNFFPSLVADIFPMFPSARQQGNKSKECRVNIYSFAIK